MRQEGLMEVKNPSEFMLDGKPEGASGSVVACSLEGSRPIMIEIQALVCHSNFGIPRRTANGTDFNRVNLLMAVLEKRARMNLSSSDAYVNIAGGIKMTEPAVDLGILLAIASSQKDLVISEKTVVFGEVGLSGEVRSVSMADQRVQEAEKLGFETVILPKVCMKSLLSKNNKGIHLVPVENIKDAHRFIEKDRYKAEYTKKNKKLRKRVDFLVRRWYHYRSCRKNDSKERQKKLKKVLTKQSSCGILNKLSRETSAQQCREP